MLKHAGPGIEAGPLATPCEDAGVSFGAAFWIPLKGERIEQPLCARAFYDKLLSPDKARPQSLVFFVVLAAFAVELRVKM